jgi:hypothetical protein
MTAHTTFIVQCIEVPGHGDGCLGVWATCSCGFTAEGANEVVARHLADVHTQEKAR